MSRMLRAKYILVYCLLLILSSTAMAELPGWRLAVKEDFSGDNWTANWAIQGDIGRTDDGALRSAGKAVRAQFKLPVKATSVRVEFQAAMLEPDDYDRISDLSCMIGDVAFLFGSNDNRWTGLTQNGFSGKRFSKDIELRKLYTFVAEIDGKICRFYIDNELVAMANREDYFDQGHFVLYSRRGRAMFDNVRILLRKKRSADNNTLNQLAPPRFASVTPDDTVFTTWQDDPTTTVTAQWLSSKLIEQAAVEYAVKGTDDWKSVKATNMPFPFSNLHRYRAHMEGLSPDTTYDLRFAGGSRIGYVRTMPDKLDEPITYINGGDVSDSDMTVQVCTVAAKRSPRFALMGGDLAYANGRDVGKWVGLLRIWRRTMIDPEGRLIPFIAAIGNHEVDGGFGRSRKDAPLTLSLFNALNRSSYHTFTCGDYLTLYLLDSGHINEVAGTQTNWLSKTLAADRAKHQIVYYHVPAYPSVRPFENGYSTPVREHWVPLFEKHGIKSVFEHHEHAYKRTHPLLSDKIDENGVTYFGDGAWGVAPRPVHSLRRAPYLKVAERINHFFETTLTATDQQHRAFDPEGNLIDESVIPIK